MAVILPQTMQRDIQSSMPIIPNNGNPGGAYNMAANVEGAVAPQAAPPNPYDWLQPSPYMEEVAQLLKWQDGTLKSMYETVFPPQRAQVQFGLPSSANGQLAYTPYGEEGLPFVDDQDGSVISFPVPRETLPVIPGE